jgi:hypothetical protein
MLEPRGVVGLEPLAEARTMDDPSLQQMAPHLAREQDIGFLVGLLAILEGEIWAGTAPEHLTSRVADRLAEVGLLTAETTTRKVRQALNDLNHRLRYVLGEYPAPINPEPVPE